MTIFLILSILIAAGGVFAALRYALHSEVESSTLFVVVGKNPQQSARRDIVALIVLILLLAGSGLAAEGSPNLSPGKYGRVSFSTPVQFGQRVLPAGSYEFHCVHKGQYHLMAVYQDHPGPARKVVASGKPMATDYCRMETLPEKTQLTSAIRTNKGSGGIVLVEIRIQGEQIRHIFTEPLPLKWQIDPVQIKSTLDLLRLMMLTGGRR